MFCVNCGKQLADDAKFCNGCGSAVGQPAAGGSQPNVNVKKPSGSKLPLVIGICAAVAVVAVSSVALLAKFRSDDKDADAVSSKVEKEVDINRGSDKVEKVEDIDKDANQIAAVEEIESVPVVVEEPLPDNYVLMDNQPSTWRQNSDSEFKGQNIRDVYVDVINSAVIKQEDIYLCSDGFSLDRRTSDILWELGATRYVETDSRNYVSSPNKWITRGYLETEFGNVDCAFACRDVIERGESLLMECVLYILVNDDMRGDLNDLNKVYFVFPQYVLKDWDNDSDINFFCYITSPLRNADASAAFRNSLPDSLKNMSTFDMEELNIVYSGSVYSIQTLNTSYNFQLDFGVEDNMYKISGITYLGTSEVNSNDPYGIKQFKYPTE